MQSVMAEELPENGSVAGVLPRQFLQWLPFLWSRVLFSGRDVPQEPVRLASLLLLLVLPGILLYGCLSFHLFEPDEGRYAEIPREMLLRGEWVVPYLEGEPYLDKPPLLYWLVGLSYRALGVHDWSARLVPALAVHACILLTYLFGRRLLGERAALCGAIVLALAPGLVSIGRLLVMDGLLALWTVLGLFAGFECIRGPRVRMGWGILAACACGLGILTKGPVAVILVLPPLLAYRWLAGRSCRVGGWRMAVLGLVTLAIALPWYVAICVRLPEFAYHFLWQHNVVRFVAPFDHQRPIWFYAPILLVGLLPGTLAAFGFVRFLFSSDPPLSQRRAPALGFLILGGGWCLVFFSLSGCKLPTYILPAFPPLALALGCYLTYSTWSSTFWPKTIGAAAFIFVCLGHNVVLPWYAHYRAPRGRLAELKDYCADPSTPIICYPRSCDSVAFYIGRDDLHTYRSKQTNDMVRLLQGRERTVLLLTHRHSLGSLRYALTPDLQVVEERHFGLSAIAGLPDGLAERLTGIMGETSLGLCDLAVVERRPAGENGLARQAQPPSPRNHTVASTERP